MRGGRLVLGCGADRLAQAGALQEKVQADHDQQGRAEDDGLDDRKCDTRQLHGAVVGYGHITRVRRELDFEEIGERDRDAEGDEQGHQMGALDDAVDQNDLQQIADQEHKGQDQRQ